MIELFARAVRRAARLAEPLFDPDAPDRRRREGDTARRLEQTTAALAGLTDQVTHLQGHLAKIDRTQVAALEHAVGVLERHSRRQRSFEDRLRRARASELDLEAVRDRVLRRLGRIVSGDGPILIGPWTGEVGFEVLYWAPFVRWVVQKFNIEPSRITIVSRGGTASWYPPAGRYVDIFELTTADEFRARTEGSRKKQRWMRLFDRDIVRRVAATGGARSFAVLHPALMYALFMPYWAVNATHRWIEQFTAFERIVPPPVAGLERLPRDYVAVRFYFSDCFPATADNRALAADLVRAAAAQGPVVVLGSGVRVDDHAELTVAGDQRIHSIDHLLRPETNLAVQTAIIAGARAVIGTYGGFSYVAPFCGVNALAVSSRPTYYVNHLGLAASAFERTGGATLTVADVATLRQTGLPAALTLTKS